MERSAIRGRPSHWRGSGGSDDGGMPRVPLRFIRSARGPGHPLRTCKTCHAHNAARDLAALAPFGVPYETLNAEQRAVVDDDEQAPGLVRI
jgi:hypothetical protein